MTSGGARTRSGPAPDPGALARDRPSDPSWTVLSVTGRPGPAPDWPLMDASGRELELWTGLWGKPQAAQWERYGQELQVALYVRRLAEVEVPGAPASIGTLVRQMADALGLTIPGMRSLRWHLGSDSVATPSGPKPARPVRRTSARNRLTVVPGDGA